MQKTKQQILEEYNVAASTAANEHEMHIWRNAESWLNRFELVSGLVDWQNIRSWVDVGCGTGKFFESVLAGNDNAIKRICGYDAVENYLSKAREKSWPGSLDVMFKNQDIEFMKTEVNEKFDLVTIIGVIYQCGIPFGTVVENLCSIVAPSGTLVITTENPDFHMWTEENKAAYPSIADLSESITKHLKPASLTVYYANPLDKDAKVAGSIASVEKYKEVYLIAKA